MTTSTGRGAHIDPVYFHPGMSLFFFRRFGKADDKLSRFTLFPQEPV